MRLALGLCQDCLSCTNSNIYHIFCLNYCSLLSKLFPVGSVMLQVHMDPRFFCTLHTDCIPICLALADFISSTILSIKSNQWKWWNPQPIPWMGDSSFQFHLAVMSFMMENAIAFMARFFSTKHINPICKASTYLMHVNGKSGLLKWISLWILLLLKRDS